MVASVSGFVREAEVPISDRRGLRLIIEATPLDGVKVVVPKKFEDSRGFFSETFHRERLLQAGIDAEFVQDNQSCSAAIGTIRGLHFQSPPFAQAKLIRVLKGRIFDAVVDIRRSSPTYGQHYAVELSAENFKQLFVPIGFAHGYCTLEPDTEILYKVTNYYAPEHDHGLAFDDPALGIAWPVAATILSEKDKRHPRFADLQSPFQ